MKARGSLAWTPLILLAILEVAVCIAGSVSGCKIVTILGSEPVYILASSLLIILLDGGIGVRITLAVALASSMTVAGKAILQLPRPPAEEWLVEASGYAFPSGHATLSAAFWTAAYLETRNTRLLTVGILHTLAVSYSRLVLGVHYPRDVIGGILVGILATAVAYKLLYNRWGPPHWIVASSIIVTLLGTVALAGDPGYDSAVRLTGIGLGSLLAGVAYMRRLIPLAQLVKPIPRHAKIASLPILAVGLVIAYASEGSLLTGIVGYAILAFLVFTARTLGCMVTRCFDKD